MSDGRKEKAKSVARKLLKFGALGIQALNEATMEVHAKVREGISGEAIPIVAILVPCYKAPHPRMNHKLREMVNYCRKNGICEFVNLPLIRNSVVHWQRNDLLSELIKSGNPFTHVLFIDDDIVPEQDHLEKLLAAKKDIVGGLCTFRQDPPIPNARFYEPSIHRYSEMWYWDKEGLVPVDAVGTGMMLISQQALQKIADVWFTCAFEKKQFGISEELTAEWNQKRLEEFDSSGNAWWFQFLPTPDAGVREYGEDISFCWKAKNLAGLEIFVDTTVNPEHMGDYGFSIRDYKSQREFALAKAKAEGRTIIRPDATIRPDEEPLKISILVPTRGRPENVKRLLASIVATAADLPQVVFYVDEDDFASSNAMLDGCGYPPEKIFVQHGPRITLSQCWNELEKVATGDVLMQAADDILFHTKDWDAMVKNAFRQFPDKIIFVHGDDGHWGKSFGTHGFVHRNWIKATGNLLPPHFSSDYADKWLNEVANAIGRRVYLPIKTEHLHPLWGKAEWDQTHRDRLERHERDNVDQLYIDLEPERLKDIENLKAAMTKQEAVAVG